MIRTDLLNGEIARAGLSKAELARRLHMTPKTLYCKLKNGVLGSDEIEGIIRECGISNPMPIFFPDVVTQQVTSNK